VTAHAEQLRMRRAPVLARAADLIADNSLLVVLVAVLGAVLLGVAQQLTVADSWMTLVAGREIAHHGLPSHEVLTAIPYGRTWTDQQWFAQIVFYASTVVGGLRLAIVLNVAAITVTLALVVAAARRRGASARSTLLVASVSLFVAPWSWQLRAQALALPLFVLVLQLASSDVRKPRARTFLALPLLVLWANIHGSVLLGAGLVSLAGLFGLLRRPLRSAALVLLPWACVLISPYGFHLVGYYRLLLFTSPVSKVIVEWQAPKPHGYDLIFFAVAAITVILSIWQRRRLAYYDIAVLAVTLAGSLRSGRGIVWFTLAMAVILPSVLDGVFRGGEAAIRRRLGLASGVAAIAVLLVMLVAIGSKPDSWFEREWPVAAARAVATAAATAPGRQAVFPSDTTADWLLWKEPSLRGRVAYDVRFEILTAAQLGSLVRFKSTAPDWMTPAAAYPVLVLDPSEGKRRVVALSAVPGTRVLFRSKAIVVLARPVG